MSEPQIPTSTLDELLTATRTVVEQHLDKQGLQTFNPQQLAGIYGGVDLTIRALNIAAGMLGPDVTVVGASVETLVRRLSEAWEASA